MFLLVYKIIVVSLVCILQNNLQYIVFYIVDLVKVNYVS